MISPTNGGISVVIPFYNPGIYLAEAVESVLNQELRPQEIILISEGSDEESNDIARRYLPDVTLVLQERKGVGAARNTDIRMAKHEFLSFLDADDIWERPKLKLQYDYLNDHPECDMVFGQVEQFISPELPAEHGLNIRENLVRMSGIVPGTLLIRRETFFKVGLFMEQHVMGEFIDWYSRANDLMLTHHVLNEVVLRRRIHGNNMGILQRDKLKDYTSVLRMAIARRRNKP